MFSDKISDYFEGVAAKYLSAVDSEPDSSNQHEIGGLVRAGFKPYLGDGQNKYHYRARQVYISDNNDEPLTCDSMVTWYGATRKGDPNRRPEFKLYYRDSIVTESFGEGDFFLIAKLRDGVLSRLDGLRELDSYQEIDGELLMVFTPSGSSIEHQLRAMFGLDSVGTKFNSGKLDAVSMLLPLRMMLEDLGVEVETKPSRGSDWLDLLLHHFGGEVFPTTSVFSQFARDSIAEDVSPIEMPDATLMHWMEQEESLFRIYERHIVQKRLKAGFGDDGQDVDDFISFSLSVQNRRKSRVGHAFEGHLECLFNLHDLKFEQGRGKGKVTENNKRPDFIFPSFAAYHNESFPTASLMMLGAKTTLKDRWRQVPSEANRISEKHLVTMEAAISKTQFEEMSSQQLQLVVPTPIQSTYSDDVKSQLMDVHGFIRMIRDIQGEG